MLYINYILENIYRDNKPLKIKVMGCGCKKNQQPEQPTAETQQPQSESSNK